MVKSSQSSLNLLITSPTGGTIPLQPVTNLRYLVASVSGLTPKPPSTVVRLLQTSCLQHHHYIVGSANPTPPFCISQPPLISHQNSPVLAANPKFPSPTNLQTKAALRPQPRGPYKSTRSHTLPCFNLHFHHSEHLALTRIRSRTKPRPAVLHPRAIPVPQQHRPKAWEADSSFSIT